MPIFEYVCEDCHEEFEKLVGREEEIPCPACNSRHVSKQFSRFGMGANSTGRFESLPQYKAGGGCGCTPSSCGCKH